MTLKEALKLSKEDIQKLSEDLKIKIKNSNIGAYVEQLENKEINICATNFEELKDIANLITTEENILKTMIKNVIKYKKTGIYNGMINLKEKIFE